MFRSIPRDGSVDTRAPVSARSSQIDRWAARGTDRGRPFSESYSSEGVLPGTPGSFQDEVHVGTTGFHALETRLGIGRRACGGIAVGIEARFHEAAEARRTRRQRTALRRAGRIQGVGAALPVSAAVAAAQDRRARQAGPPAPRTGAVIFAQRFGGAPNVPVQ